MKERDFEIKLKMMQATDSHPEWRQFGHRQDQGKFEEGIWTVKLRENVSVKFTAVWINV